MDSHVDIPFTLTAGAYLAHGFYTFPVMGKDNPAKHRTGNGGRCDEETIRHDLKTRPYGHDNVAIRHDGTVAIDIDEYGERHGVSDIREFADKHNLSPLPAAPSSTARGDSRPQSRQYFYRLSDPSIRLIGKLADGVDICQAHHRYSVVYPSVHPLGMIYEWFEPGEPGIPPTWGPKTSEIPYRDELPVLPADWEEALRSQTDPSLVDYAATVTGVEELLETFVPGEPCARVERAWEIARGHTGVHDHCRDDLFKAFRLGIEGHPGAADLVRYLAQQRRDYCERDNRSNVEADVTKLVRDTATHAQRVLVASGSHDADCGSSARLTPLHEIRALRITDDKPTSSTDNPGFVSAPTADDWGSFDDPVESDDPFTLPDSIWETSDEMRAIRDAAYARQVSPDVVLHGCLALIASLVHPHSTLDTGTGESTLSYYAAAVGGSGTGKTKGFACAESLMKDWVKGRRDTFKGTVDNPGYHRAELGTGEGVVEAFMGLAEEFIPELDPEPPHDPLMDDDGQPLGKYKKVRKQVRGNVMFVADEGRRILETARRPGSTIMSTICTMWSGASAGSSNAKSENTRILEGSTYVLGMFVGFQPNTMDDLFADAGGGAPQRFLFASAKYPRLPSHRTPWPTYTLSPWLPGGPLRMQLGEAEQDFVWEHAHKVSKGEIELSELDGHKVLLRCRVAALLMILHSQNNSSGCWVVPEKMWEIAETIVDTSCAYRDYLSERAKREAAEQAKQRAEAQIQVTVRSAEIVSRNTKLEATIDRIVELVETTDDDAECTPAKITKRLTRSQRDMKEPALLKALDEGRLEVVNIPNPKAGPRTINILRVKD